MESYGYGGRGNVHYGPDGLLIGVRVDDPPKEPVKGWNKPKVVMTPFGPRIFRELMIMVCGVCKHSVFNCTCNQTERKDND